MRCARAQTSFSEGAETEELDVATVERVESIAGGKVVPMRATPHGVVGSTRIRLLRCKTKGIAVFCGVWEPRTLRAWQKLHLCTETQIGGVAGRCYDHDSVGQKPSKGGHIRKMRSVRGAILRRRNQGDVSCSGSIEQPSVLMSALVIIMTSCLPTGHGS